MRSRAIYFPFISVPETKWAFNTLLYWEKLASIVPIEYLESPHQYSDFMRILVSEGLVDQIIPREHIYQIPDFETSFISYIEKRLRRWRLTRHFSRLSPRNYFKRSSLIHMEKMGNLPYFLEQEGLAKRKSDSWFEVENWIAGPFMAYLASVLGALKEVDSAPVTDNLHMCNYYQAFRIDRRPQRGRPSIGIAEARDFILEHILPVPKDKISIGSVVRFKERYGHLLPEVREKIEIYSAEIASINNQEERNARAETITLELKDDISEITEAMKLSWNNIIFGSITPLVGAGGALYVADAAQSGIATGAAGFSFLAACYNAISSANPERVIESRPLAYFAFAKKEFQ